MFQTILQFDFQTKGNNFKCFSNIFSDNKETFIFLLSFFNYIVGTSKTNYYDKPLFIIISIKLYYIFYRKA